jgi:hypothetical protein
MKPVLREGCINDPQKTHVILDKDEREQLYQEIQKVYEVIESQENGLAGQSIDPEKGPEEEKKS